MKKMHSYIKYLTQEDPIITDEGKQIEILHLDIQDDSEIFEDWAKQFRRNYCSDDELAEMTGCMNISTKEYLENFKLPSDSGIGLSTMSGDFGEILVSDYLQYVEEYVVPRTRYNRKVNKDTLTQGSDVLGYKKDSLNAVNDEVVVIEVKSSASNSSTVKAKNKLQEAINHSNKDFKRFSTSIVASYLRLKESNIDQANVVERFLNITDNPFNVIYGAAAVHSGQSYDIDIIKQAVSKNHKDYQKLRLLVIHSDELMEFIKELYSKASEV
ncbi:Hachiman antiphage defense system protein HamA [Streptococcus dysgalactiae]|uniref:Hachiman antiphage defense system protein HamA n=1 Tax=Streptococcus dysgalactiae TaxID=1334 RepID=UPI0024B778C7|nr:Hachiman antiphage defense system protein HamA [Streptococcus dysgalactiae]